MINRKRVAAVALAILAIVGLAIWLVFRPDNSATEANSATQNKQVATFDMQRFSTDDPNSPWVIVNKRRPLNPKDFTPPLAAPSVPLRLNATNPEMQLSTAVIPAVEALFAAAKTDGLQLMVASGFRSYQQQVTVYNAEVAGNGQQAADRESARPGHSEHQTGQALDVEPASRECEVQACFGELPEGKWIANNAYKFGFVIRYMPNNETITGYTYEPWHIRYVGKELAAEIYKQGNPALENFFNLGAAPDYQ
jgi:zinc D-Ala-D-Ala carboxypeptidase